MNHTFHLSLPCKHIPATKRFYTEIVGAELGRQSQNWVDVNLFGHQITFTKSGNFNFQFSNYSFDKTVLPSFHFGIILDHQTWDGLYKKFQKEDFLFIDKTKFLTEKKGEHDSFFLRDPNGYVLEFKCFQSQGEVFNA